MNQTSNQAARTINVGNRLTIETITDFAQQIRTGFNEADAVVVAFEPEIEIDVTALQVFCAACKTAAAEGKRFAYSGPQPQALRDLVAATGSERHKQCLVNSSACFRRSQGE
ncbi:STAS domain-containing protein [Desulfobulbus sp.]|uniref:STAS domain-containing protein n=1 Tax=Desulfobulbus sp. TaxID=895 RepID=UPI0027B92982|nr:STAS domain-containing protein [Desulfobulbus sp.]